MLSMDTLLAQENSGEDLGIDPVDLTMAAFVLPPVIAIINQRRWSTEVKALVALLVCATYSAGVTLLRGETNWQDWRNALLQVCAGAFAAYKLFWIPSGLAAKIESRTSIPPTTPEQDRTLPATTLQEVPPVAGHNPEVTLSGDDAAGRGRPLGDKP